MPGHPKKQAMKPLPLRQNVDPIAVSLALFKSRQIIGEMAAKMQKRTSRKSLQISSKKPAFKSILREANAYSQILVKAIAEFPISRSAKVELIYADNSRYVLEKLIGLNFKGDFSLSHISRISEHVKQKWLFVLKLALRSNILNKETARELNLVIKSFSQELKTAKRRQNGKLVSLQNPVFLDFCKVGRDVLRIYSGYILGEHSSSLTYFEDVRAEIIKKFFS